MLDFKLLMFEQTKKFTRTVLRSFHNYQDVVRKPGTWATSVATSNTAISAISTRLFTYADLEGRCSKVKASMF